nr:F-box protein At4g02760 isoform X3 [Arachis hypogaea]
MAMDTFPCSSKRPCPSSSQEQNNARVVQGLDHVEQVLHKFLCLDDDDSTSSSPSPSSPCSSISLDLSLEKLLESSASDADRTVLIDRALRMGSMLLDAAKHSSRKRASKHNSLAWPLPPDLTIKVFSMLETQSLCHASATCSLFNKCAKDPLCYANLDLTSRVPKINNSVVSTMIQRAGNALRILLRKLYLYNIERMDNASLGQALSACPSLLDLEIVGLHVELRQTLMSVSANCHSIERLCFESSKTGRDDSLKTQTCLELVDNCPHLTSLSLRGFKLHDYKVRVLVKGFQKLKYVDFSTSYSITGSFLRSLGSCMGGNLLEVLILRDCMHLKEVEVARFLTAILAGDFKFLLRLDISNKEGLASEGDWYHRCFNSSIMPVKQVLEARPDINLVAEYPAEGSYNDSFDTDMNSEISLPSQLSSHNSDRSIFLSTSESSYNSDQGSGNEDGQDASYVIYEESSDEIDFLSL